jgi:hypothetical protein
VKVHGRRLYIVDLNTRIGSIVWVRDRVARGRKRIEFVVVKKTELTNEQPSDASIPRALSTHPTAPLQVPRDIAEPSVTKRAQTGGHHHLASRLKDFGGFVKSAINNLNKTIANNGSASPKPANHPASRHASSCKRFLVVKWLGGLINLKTFQNLTIHQ